MKSNLIAKIKNNSKIVENYFFMTSLQLISSIFGIVIYPYLIRVLGASSYGLYVFALSITAYFIGVVSFGFNFPALKSLIENKDSPFEKSKLFSSVFSAKLYLAVGCSLLFVVITAIVPFIKENWVIFAITFSQLIAEVLNPFWYFQGIQKMRIITYIQLSLKVLSLPFIFLLIRNADDIVIYTIIMSSSVILGGLISTIYLIKVEKLKLKIIPPQALKNYFKSAMPFFWSNSFETIKEESVALIIGLFFGMRDVALYDLAKKIITLPRILTMSINNAMFPKIMENLNARIIKNIIKYETLIGLSIIMFIAIFGRWIILILGGKLMLDAYAITVILSVTILNWLVGGCYISFVFVPKNRYYYVTRNQMIALFAFLIICIPGVLIYRSISAIVVALTLSGIVEIIYCTYIVKKHKLL